LKHTLEVGKRRSIASYGTLTTDIGDATIPREVKSSETGTSLRAAGSSLPIFQRQSP